MIMQEAAPATYDSTRSIHRPRVIGIQRHVNFGLAVEAGCKIHCLGCRVEH